MLIAQRWPARQSAFLFLAELNAVVRVLVLVIELNVVSGPAGPNCSPRSIFSSWEVTPGACCARQAIDGSGHCTCDR